MNAKANSGTTGDNDSEVGRITAAMKWQTGSLSLDLINSLNSICSSAVCNSPYLQ